MKAFLSRSVLQHFTIMFWQLWSSPHVYKLSFSGSRERTASSPTSLAAAEAVSLSVSPSWDEPSQTGPAYSNAQHLLAFLSCLSVHYSRSGGRWRWPELSRYNIWNNVSFHSLLHWNPEIPQCVSSNLISLTGVFSSLRVEDVGAKSIQRAALLQAVEESLDLSQGFFCGWLSRADFVSYTNLWCDPAQRWNARNE